MNVKQMGQQTHVQNSHHHLIPNENDSPGSALLSDYILGKCSKGLAMLPYCVV